MSRPALPVLLLSASLCLLLGNGCARKAGEPFPVAAYLEAPDNLQGNRYTLEAEIDAQLEWREGTGRLLAVRPLPLSADQSRLPVFISDSLNANLMIAQRYQMDVSVRRGGLLYVTALRKL